MHFSYQMPYEPSTHISLRCIKCPLNNGVSIIQKLVLKLSNTSTEFSQQVEITIMTELKTKDNQKIYSLEKKDEGKFNGFVLKNVYSLK